MENASGLKLLLLLDRKPGHAHRVEGVAIAVASLTQLVPVRLQIRQRTFILVGMLRYIMKLPLSPRFGLWALYGIRLEDIERPDGIIASGRPTIAAAILLARHFKVPLIYSGRPHGYDTSEVTLQLVGKQKYAGRDGFAFVPMPGITLSAGTRQADGVQRSERPVDFALLLGGNSNDHHFSDSDWDAILRLVAQTHDALGLRWHVSTSRRSPVKLAKALQALLAAGKIEEFVDFQSAGPGSATHFYKLDALVVTHDSRSMINEAIAAGRPLVVLKPTKVESEGLDEYLDHQLRAGAFSILETKDLSSSAFLDAVARSTTAKDGADPLKMIAAAVAPVFGLAPGPAESGPTER